MIAQGLARALAENQSRIRQELGEKDWLRFRRQITPLLKQLPRNIADASALEMAAVPLWEVCQGYPFVKRLVLEYSEQRQRQVEAAGENSETELEIREVSNIFYALDAELAGDSDQGIGESKESG
ncbi:MAG: hypothetical protein JW730_12370 [Anaerolineales bacterium]|nr:hypothetical protein [Anaerolineales bacterium]